MPKQTVPKGPAIQPLVKPRTKDSEDIMVVTEITDPKQKELLKFLAKHVYHSSELGTAAQILRESLEARAELIGPPQDRDGY